MAGLVLPPAFLQGLEREVAGGGRARARVSQAILEGARGQAGAGFTLRRALAAAPDSDAARALLACLACRDAAMAEAVLSRVLGGAPVALTLGGPQSAEWPATLVRLLVSRPACLGLALPEGLLGSPQLLGMLGALLSAVELAGALLAQDDTRQGEAWLSLAPRQTQQCLAFVSNRADAVLLPDRPFLTSRGYESMRHAVERDFVRWETRRPAVFWRGTKDTLGLQAMAAQANPRHGEPVLEVALGAPPARLAEHWQACRYVLDTESGLAGSAGLFAKLYAGATLLLAPPAGAERTWLHARLQPWVHYVPVAADLSDLLTRVAWLRGQDHAAREIAEKGRILALAATYEAEMAAAAESIAQALRAPPAA